MARRVQSDEGARRGVPRHQRQARVRDEDGILPVLARVVREVEAAVERGPARPSVRTKFQVVALLVREERARLRDDPSVSTGARTAQLKRLDGVATILARTAARDTSLLALLAEEADVPADARMLRADLRAAAGVESAAEAPAPVEPVAIAEARRRVVPQGIVSRQLANPFLAPDFDAARPAQVRARRLAGWELIDPLLRSFEEAGGGAPSCMAFSPTSAGSAAVPVPGDLALMPHQSQVIAAAAAGHRTFLLADEPGLGKTAQALLAARAAHAYPLLVVVPNVVKTNWAREAALWTPERAATVVHGDGASVDGFADIVIVNYDILDRHTGWMGDLGFRGMVVDEAHFIKNRSSQRSAHVLEISARIQARTGRPLLMALTGTPLINDLEDFRAIWQFLGWIDDTKPVGDLMAALESADILPGEPGFYTAARQCVIDMGVVRRRKVDVAADIPARRVADMPVELDGEAGRSIRQAERELADRMVARYREALARRTSGANGTGIDHDLVRRVAAWEREDASRAEGGANVFAMMRRIGQAKADLAADYTAQLARSVGKVVFFAKHIDVMDAAQDLFTARGIRYASIRGEQTSRVRQRNVDAFRDDPEVAVAVCSLTAAGVGLNLQVASNMVLAELSWTAAEQTQAIDRIHRIGQEEPVTAWRIIAAQTIDARIAELIDKKAGLAARALDGAAIESSQSADIQLEALVSLLTDALTPQGAEVATGR